MATPYDGKVCLWHWEGDAVGEPDIEAVAATFEKYAPVVDAGFIKKSDGIYWQGNCDSKTTMEINGPSDIAKWVNTLSPHGIEVHVWCVIKGVNIQGEIDKITEAAQVPGVRSVILDVHCP